MLCNGVDIVTGNIVKGDDLYGRDYELDLLWKTVEKDSLLLTSPRRYGKTSVVKAMEDNPRAGWSVIYVDMEGSSDPPEFVAELSKRVSTTPLQKTRNLFRSARDATDELHLPGLVGVKLREPDVSWKEDGTEIFCELKKSSPKSIVIIDELPTYLLAMQEKYGDGGSTISAFLHWLRRIRQDLQIRFVVCGSIGIDTIVDKYRLENSVNDFARLQLLPFDDETAKGMITTLLDRYGIGHTDDLVKEIMESIGLQVPFFIQLMLKEIRDRTDFGRKDLTSEIISDSYWKGLLGAEGKKDFAWYFERLRTEFRGNDHRAALEILHLLARVPSAPEAELAEIHSEITQRDDEPGFRRILHVLETGFYIARSDAGITFHNKVLRDLWIQEGGAR